MRRARGVKHLSCLICHRHAVWHAHAPRAGCVQCLDLRGDFGGISSTSYIVGGWAQGCKDLQSAARRRRQQRA